MTATVEIPKPSGPSDLIRIRRDLGLSQADMAARVGVTKRVWQGAEAGGEPRGANALKIAAFFGLAVTDIWGTS